MITGKNRLAPEKIRQRLAQEFLPRHPQAYTEHP
jgi:hypothetical protein